MESMGNMYPHSIGYIPLEIKLSLRLPDIPRSFTRMQLACLSSFVLNEKLTNLFYQRFRVECHDAPDLHRGFSNLVEICVLSLRGNALAGQFFRVASSKGCHENALLYN